MSIQKVKILIASGNEGKIREIQDIFEEYEVISDIKAYENLHIQENGNSFEENALIKAKSFYATLKEQAHNLIVMADDSGLCVDMLEGEPGIYSARYANLDANLDTNASDSANLAYLIKKLHQKSLHTSDAKFVACIAIVGKIRGKYVEHIVRGELKGSVIDIIRGDHGFGYDPIFVPLGYACSLGELNPDEKNKISHRHNALHELKIFLNNNF
ncbi:RdgB/HAM1 family non-canonical purine NTP pyrophosphatase [Helicobacter sp. 11S03491-1]|uniref:RdgB/HAM1 family non-canonical purine NTP pyrophosphatase n=1 Tax=Helicobacter sp. 11S03491-1 TaxID=1476196 RepID=UPI000BA63BCE|nr:RdgB/HAM1 family non-canonical purine NTP pyrophosphatase [Helicobacter sp. 11S03491-1]PAF41692.1 non-canonical purine NTP pyrophosphatase, RdgB/HAM1 family [Helicobacter sp. 11S03491-1]